MLFLRGLSCTFVALLAPSGVLAQGVLSQASPLPADRVPVQTAGSTSMGASGDCTIIDFEGIPDSTPIGVIPGPIEVTFGSSWLALVDADAGGNGNFANEPSPDTVAFFLNPAEPIDFSEGVNFVEITYVASAASVPVVFTAFDGPNGTGNVIGTATGTTIGTDFDGAPCTGDPAGQFCLWSTISISVPTSSILSVTIQGVANQFAFDNMLFCREVIGDTVCQSLPNSTGINGGLVASGSDVASDNLLTLTAFDLPLNEMGYVVNSMNAGMIPARQGILCIDAGFGRHTSQVSSSGTDGVIITSIDLTALPRSSSPPAAVMAGETWYFQVWHRDGMDSNFTDAVGITFQ